MNFKFKADEILIDKLQVDLPYPVSGKASFDGVLTGKVGALNFDGIFEEILDRLGETPLPPYIHEKFRR